MINPGLTEVISISGWIQVPMPEDWSQMADEIDEAVLNKTLGATEGATFPEHDDCGDDYEESGCEVCGLSHQHTHPNVYRSSFAMYDCKLCREMFTFDTAYVIQGTDLLCKKCWEEFFVSVGWNPEVPEACEAYVSDMSGEK